MAEASDHGRVEGAVLADVGGTNVRFALLTGDMLGPIEHMAVRDHRHFTDALANFMARQTDGATIRSAFFAVAGVVEGERCALTNNPWVVDAAELRGRLGFTDVHIINDFEAVAWSLPRLPRNDLRTIGGREPAAQAPMVVLGPGTGLGVAAYVPREKGGLVLGSEGGHTTCRVARCGRTPSSRIYDSGTGTCPPNVCYPGTAWKISTAPSLRSTR